MTRIPEAEGRRWLAQAEEDMDSARLLLTGGKNYLVCFLAQQIAEKAIKAYLYFKGQEMVIGHSIEVLCRQSAAFDRIFERLRGDVSTLDMFYIPTRYPNGLPDSIPARVFNKKSATDALELASRVVGAVKKLMGPPAE
ncbi:MAG: HEPN domain-containing protein [Chloroflexi bacterium]|nr:HEPN domain-containing protein [Chloroflexota bacterium]